MATNGNPSPRLLHDAASDEAEMIIAERIADAQVTFHDVIVSDWSNTLCAAPQAIGILGECMLVSSMKAAKRVTLEHSGLKSKQLTTNLLNVFQVGRKTFLEAQIRMAAISTYSNQIGMANGMTVKSAMEANTVLDAFKEWRDEIDLLRLAVDEKHGENTITQRSLAEKSLEVKKEKENKMAKQEEARGLFSDKWLEDVGIGLGAALSVISPVLGYSLAGLTILGTWAIEHDFLNAEAMNEIRIRELQETELQERQLSIDIEKLLSDDDELIEIEDVLNRAISRLVDLQDRLQALLMFFMSTASMVRMVIEQYEYDYLPKIENDVEAANALEAAKELDITQAYVELSDKHIYGGFSEIAELGLSDSSITREGRQMKELRLKEYKSCASASVRETSSRAQRELRVSLKSIAESSAGGILIKRNIL
ncbi:hypothetical protein BKA65DRAFT_545297 [Rhexocercosporidium sp. MPI-PUGE-AT-0058]|nr:hypothetical protein BKA65DRAFT_545297 [Rhexocercosporidium sp. MPI-PUGE-AT-0058]